MKNNQQLPALLPENPWPLIFALWFCGLGAAMQFSKMSLIFEDLMHFYQTNPQQMGLALSLVGALGMVFAACAKSIVNRFGYRVCLFAVLILACVLAILQTQMLPLKLLMLTRIIEGLTHLGIVVIAPTLMATISPEPYKAKVLNLWGSFFSVAFILTGVLTPISKSFWGISGLFTLHAIWMVVATVVIFVLLKNDPIPTPVPKPSINLKDLISQHKSIYGQLRTTIPAICFFHFTLLNVPLLTILPLIKPISPDWLKIMMPFMSLLGAFSVSYLIDWKKSAVWACRLSFVMTAFVFLLMWLLTKAQQDITVLKLLSFFGFGLIQGAIYSMIPEFTPKPDEQVMALSAFAQTGNIGSTISAPIFGFLLSFFGGEAIFLAGLIVLSSGLFFVLYLPKKVKL